MSIPAPPPYGVSSTWPCLLWLKSRGLVTPIDKRSASIARFMMEWLKKASKNSGNKDTISIRIDRPLHLLTHINSLALSIYSYII